MVAAVGDEPTLTAEGGKGGGDDDRREEERYLERVMGEIDEEVRKRRASGDLPAHIDRELDELFLQFSPQVGSRGTKVSEVLRMVDASAVINPVVPVDSIRSGGGAIKRTVRSLTMWYVGFVTQQVNQFTSSVSRCLHVIESRLDDVEHELATMKPGTVPVVDLPACHRADAWWVGPAAEALAGAAGPVMHAACGDGWLVGVLRSAGVDAHGVDPRPEVVERGLEKGLDLRVEAVGDHLCEVAPGRLGGIVLSGVVEVQRVPELNGLVDQLDHALAPGGVVAIHSASPGWWRSEGAPAIADLVPGHPVRPAAWRHLLAARGFEVVLQRDGQPAPGSSDPTSVSGEAMCDYLVIAGRPETSLHVHRG